MPILIQNVQQSKRTDTTDTSLLAFVHIVVETNPLVSLVGVIWVAVMSAINHGARNAEAIKPNEGIGFWSGHCPGIGIMDYSVFAEKRDNVIVYTFHKEWGVSTDWNQKILMTYEKPVLPEAPTAALPVLDMLAKGDTTRLLIADDTDIVYAEINDGGPEPVVKKKSIYILVVYWKNCFQKQEYKWLVA